jgi:competence protein ComGC
MIELLTTYNIVIGISVVINIVLLIGVRNLLKQNEQLEDRLVKTTNDTIQSVGTALDKMRELDNREVFEKDDEVGVTFLELKNIVETLNREL